MASQNSSTAPALVVRDFSTIEEIIEYIDNTRLDLSAHDCDCAGKPILGFHWQASKVDELFEQLDARLAELDEPKIRRFEYDYESETVFLDIMGESELHYQAQAGLRRYIENRIAELPTLATMDDPKIRHLIRSIEERGTFFIKYKSKIRKQADSESRQHVERKARQYIDSSDGKIQVALILVLQYPGMKKAWVSLLAADDPSSSWVQHSDLFHDDDLDQQPAGQVALYLSDFVGLVPGMPAALCRPSTAEVAAGITRNPMIAVTYERLRAIFRRARHLHSPTQFTTEAGDEEENPYEDAERRLAEARKETERRLAEARNETEWRLAEARNEAEWCLAEARNETEWCLAEARNEARIETERRVVEARNEALNEARLEMDRRMAEMERRMAAEIEQRVAEGRLDAE
ncbi:hypothetical protein C8A00DRAFT_46103 [Chaetomidium leptoderma]|uniref:Uncharacterized protein n=1 Tax=Chaetomidium leptoderma TaxID=669021 RepID=A0AAN6VFI0_9PEZI|nr:hypothetical protein C8A00DRAFT_46103 [Chaetomidium leptoderma]